MSIRRTRKLMTVLSLVVMMLVLGACTSPCSEEIAISSPTPGLSVTSPVTVTGTAKVPFEGTVLVRVWDSNGQQIGFEPGTVTGGEMGQCGSFTVDVPFTSTAPSEPGLIQVFTESPMNGQLIHLSSVGVQLSP